MRWEDERYVRVYTRDSPEWTMLSWEARGVFLLLLRVVDRAGTIQIGKAGARGLAAVLRAPIDVVERALTELTDDGCVLVSEGVLVVPNFVEAQETHQSDAARKRASRDRARAAAMSPGTDSVTNRDRKSQIVTESHDRSHAVTVGHDRSQSVTPCCAVPSHAEPELSHAGAREEQVLGLQVAAAGRAGSPPADHEEPSRIRGQSPQRRADHQTPGDSDNSQRFQAHRPLAPPTGDRNGSPPPEPAPEPISDAGAELLTALREHPATSAIATPRRAEAFALSAAAVGLPVADAKAAIGEAASKESVRAGGSDGPRDPDELAAYVCGFLAEAARRRKRGPATNAPTSRAAIAAARHQPCAKPTEPSDYQAEHIRKAKEAAARGEEYPGNWLQYAVNQGWEAAS